jgi:hypothetical protein
MAKRFSCERLSERQLRRELERAGAAKKAATGTAAASAGERPETWTGAVDVAGSGHARKMPAKRSAQRRPMQALSDGGREPPSGPLLRSR